MILPNLDDGSAWTEFVTADTSRPRLLNVLRLLRGESNPTAYARAAHVLMLLRRPRFALKLLAARSDSLAVGQRQLARCALAKVGQFDQLADVLAQPELPPAKSSADREGYVRDQLARGMAYSMSGQTEKADRALLVAAAIAKMEGLLYLHQNALRSTAQVEGENQIGRLRQYALNLRFTPYQYMLRRVAEELRDIWFARLEFSEIIAFVDELAGELPEVNWWAEAARALRDGTSPPSMSLAASDPLMHTAWTFHLSRQMARHRERLESLELADIAGNLLMSPFPTTWQKRFLPSRSHYVAAYVYSGQMAEAVREATTLGDIPDGELPPEERLMRAVAVTLILTEGGTYPANFPPRRVVSEVMSASHAMSPNKLERLLLILAQAAPSAILALSHLPDLPQFWRQPFVLGRILVLTDTALLRGQLPVSHPGGVGGQQLRQAFLASPTAQKSRPDRTFAYRHRQTLGDYDQPLAVMALAQRALDYFAADVPSVSQARQSR